MKKLAFMASGNGSNVENIIREILAGRLEAEAAIVICDKPGAGVIERAKRLGVLVAVVDRKNFPTKEAFEQEIMRQIDIHAVDYIVLGGYMRILTADFVNRYWGRIINIHPSLLPAFPGAHGIRDAWEAKVPETGVTVHFVDNGVDTGPVIARKKVPVGKEDTLKLLEDRVHAAEYELYPEALRLVLSGKAKMPEKKQGC